MAQQAAYFCWVRDVEYHFHIHDCSMLAKAGDAGVVIHTCLSSKGGYLCKAGAVRYSAPALHRQGAGVKRSQWPGCRGPL